MLPGDACHHLAVRWHTCIYGATCPDSLQNFGVAALALRATHGHFGGYAEIFSFLNCGLTWLFWWNAQGRPFIVATIHIDPKSHVLNDSLYVPILWW